MRMDVLSSQIVVNGIPVRQDFHFRTAEKGTVKELLVMGGGLGLIPRAEEFLSALATSPDVHVTVITGKNESLRRE